MTIIFLSMILIIGLLTHFQPIIDKNEKGQIVLNYRPHRRTKTRKNKILW